MVKSSRARYLSLVRVGLACFVFVAACGGVIVEGDGGPDVKTDSPMKIDAAACTCSNAQWCKHDVTCGSVTGTCMSRPKSCPDLYAPVCGFDGQVYPNECSANANGVDTSPSGGCVAPSGWVSCGASFCDATGSYCQSTGNDVASPGQPCTFYGCQPLPTSCKSTKDCSCFGGSTPCVSTCTFDGDGFQLVCPGG